VVAVLKRLGMVDGLKVNPQLYALIANRNLTGLIDHFVNLLDFERGALFRASGTSPRRSPSSSTPSMNTSTNTSRRRTRNGQAMRASYRRTSGTSLRWDS